jgi:hypothetical protein
MGLVEVAAGTGVCVGSAVDKSDQTTVHVGDANAAMVGTGVSSPGKTSIVMQLRSAIDTMASIAHRVFLCILVPLRIALMIRFFYPRERAVVPPWSPAERRSEPATTYR